VGQPDLCVVCDLAKIDRRGRLGAPGWVIKNSVAQLAGTRYAHQNDLYTENGVREYWIAYPGEQIVTAYLLDADGQHELTGTCSQPGLMPSGCLPELAGEWAGIFEEAK